MVTKKLTFFQKKLITVIGIAMIIIVGLILLFFYFRNDIQKTNTKIAQYKTELKNRQSIIERIEKLEKELKEAEPYLIKLKQSLPTETETVNLETQLKQLADGYSLNFSFRFGTLNKETENEPQSYNFNLNVSGRFDNLIKWLEEVNKIIFSLRLEKIEVTQISPSIVTKIKRGNQTITQVTPPSYEIKIVGRIYLR